MWVTDRVLRECPDTGRHNFWDHPSSAYVDTVEGRDSLWDLLMNIHEIAAIAEAGATP